MAKIIFSFDLGTTSIGWGVTQAETKLQKLCFGDADQFFSPLMPYKILGAGVRIFDEPRDPKSKQPINVARRTARLARRVIRRRRQRKAMLREILCEYGFLPKLTLDPHGEWQRVMGSGNDHDRNGARETVFALRAAALDHGLSAFDLGRVLYHMASHRQFSGRDLIEETEASKKPQNKEMQAQAKEEQKANQVREATASILEQEKISFGEYLSRLAPDQKKRGKLSDRVQIENEFLRIIETQMVYHPSLKHISAQLQDIIFAQKPVFWRLSTLGSCVFHPDHPLLMKGSWLACQKRMLENLNNLRVEQDNYRPLSSEEREIILNLLQTSKGLSFAAIRKALKFHKTTKFNLEVNGGLKQMPGNPIEASLYEIFGEQWQGHTQQAWLRDNLQDFLFSVNYQRIGDQRIAILGKQAREAERKKFIKCLIEEKGLKTDQAEAIGNIKLMSGWEPYSKGAMMSFLPKLEAGHAFGSLLHSPEFEEWRNDAFPNRIKPTGELYNLLPSPNQTHQGKQEMRYLTSLRNPTLQRTLNQLRKVVNNLIREYGKPDLIRLESTRNLSLGARDKDALEKSQNRQEKARNEAKNFLKEHWPHDPKHGDIEKYILWQECGQQCPYTGEKISFEALFIRNEFQVEHIYPRWRSLDDSFKNKTLCKTSENAFKSNHIPYEAYGDNAEKYDQIIRRLESMVKDHKMHKQKLKRFQAKEIPNGFVNNQLTNTSYIARQARDFMKRLWPDLGAESPVKVQFFSGRATSQLRHLWGLNSLLSKDDQKSRDDHRHHALDALVVACITPAMIDQLSRYFKNKDNPYSIKPVFSLPWERFYADMGASLNAIIVSHRVSAKISGPLHEGSYFKRTGIKDGTTPAGEDYEKFVIREPLNKPISVKNIENIVDERVREIVAAHLEKYGGNAKAAFGGDDMPHMVKKDGSQGPVIKRVRIYDKSQPRLMVEAASSWVKKGNNHHIAIYENYSDGNPKKGNIWEICSLYDAAQRLSRKQPVIEAYHQQGGKLLFSLVKGDMIAVPDDHGKIEYWVVSSLMANGQVPMVKHNDAALDKVIWKPRCYLLANKGAYKVSIDPIGKIHKAK